MKTILNLFFSILFSASCFAVNSIPPSAYQQSVLEALPAIPGWCSQSKATAMMHLILETKPNVCVEIGVFAGASLFTTASTLKYLQKGIVYGIDPWETSECLTCYTLNDPNWTWWSQLDMPSFHRFCVNLIQSNGLKKYCTILKMTSAKAAAQLPSIDILHIDGNHCDASAFIDVTNYVPKVKVGGYIWFDGWSTAPAAFEYIKATCQVRRVVDGGKCILLQKINSES